MSEELKNEEIKEEQESQVTEQEKILKVTVDVLPDFSYIEYHTDGIARANGDLRRTEFSFIRDISLINTTLETVPGLVIKFVFDNEAFSIDDYVLPPIPSSSEPISLSIPFLKVKKPLIDKLIEKISCELSISLMHTNGDDEEIIYLSKHIFNVLPISQPTEMINADQRLFAKYVTPLAPLVKQITNKAVVYNDGKSIVSYQNPNTKIMLNELEAIFTALHEANILYQNPPANDSFAQRVRLPEEVLKDKKATCLDSSILYCSVLMELGYHPFLILIDGHAFCGVFLVEDDCFNGGLTDKLSDVTNRYSAGSQTAVLIETTSITTGNTYSLQDAIDYAKSHLVMYEGKRFNAIDINWCHVNGVYSPIPTEGNDFELENYIKQKEIEKRDLKTIINKEYENIESKFQMDRFKSWERKLLDLSEKNKLVNFRIDSNNCIRLIGHDLIKTLCDNDSINLSLTTSSHIDIVSRFMKRDNDCFSELLNSFDNSTLLAFGLESTLRTLMRKAKTALEETGASPLYLSLGILTYESPKTHHRIHAPFLLLPINIKRESGGKRYTMSFDIGDLKINETFFQYYQLFNPDVNFNSIIDFDDISKYDDVVHTFREICGGDIALDNNFFFISNMSFAHQVMWLDMVKRKTELSKNNVIRSIIDNEWHLNEEIIDKNQSVEELEKYEDFAAPLYYDSSQLKAILDCGQGKSFILDGPPGTGKSQTIVNMIINSFYNNKRVLFVAEKKAALDVVSDRLNKLGLGNYCLELHSNKATKSDFFSKLGAVMDFGPTKNPSGYHDNCVELTKKKNELRSSINKMHDSSKYYYSLYDCIVNLKQYQYLSPYKINFDESFINALDKEKYNRIERLIDTYISFAKGVHNYDSSLLKAIGIQKLNFFNDRETVKNELDSSINTIQVFIKSLNTFISSIPFKFVLNEKNVDSLFKIYDYAYNYDLYLNSLSDLIKDDNCISQSFESVEKYNNFKENYNLKYDIDQLITNVNLDDLTKTLKSADVFFKKINAKNYIKKTLQPYTKYKINSNSIGSILLNLLDYLNKKKEFENECDVLTKITSLNLNEILNNIDEIKEKVNNTKNFIGLIKELVNIDNITEAIIYFANISKTKDGISKLAYEMAFESYKKYKEVDSLLIDKYVINKTVISKGGNYFDQLIKVLKFASSSDNFSDLVDLVNVNRLTNGFKEEGIYQLLEQVLLSNCRYLELPELLKISISYSCLSLYFADEQINDFSPVFLNDQIKKYKEAIKNYSETTVECVSAKISESFARSDITYSSSGAIGRLKKSIANNGRGVTIRGTLSEFGDVILKYFPCFLMSPLSAAQYLSVDSEKGKSFSKFDIVIFDEASQIPTHEAIGPIARGNSLIIAGDPKQMPPSPYFSSGLQVIDDDEEDDATKYTDSPSLLDECLSIDMPRHRLSYHYRSKHESLIKFSNDNFYDSKLYTFPSSSTASSCIEFKYVDMKNKKTDSSLSDEELNALLNTFKSIYQNPKTLNKSVGIISFNIKQADRIMDAINDLLGEDKKLAQIVEDASSSTKEPWFVKSIENVQGDERDIIILSVGFSLNKNGYPSVRGPLVAGDNNGERRLNVAASRSKEKMYVISTIKSSQFQDDSQIRNPGTKCLKHFLKYAEDASFASNNENKLDENSISYYIKEDLEKHGFDVDANIGNSEFKVDLALKNKSSDKYELGILIDTKSINNSISFRDKLYVQESVLNAMKWKTITIYSLEYFKYPEETINKIIEAYGDSYVKDNNDLNISIEKKDIESLGAVYDTSEYTEPEIYYISYSNDDGYDTNIKYFINQIIDALSPVSYNTIKKYVGLACEFKAFNDIREERLTKILNRYLYENRTYDQTQYFYWKDNSRTVEKFRTSHDRDIYDIAKEEIANAMAQINKIQYGISQDDLYKQLMYALDIKTKAVTRYYKERFDEAYNYAIEKGLLN